MKIKVERSGGFAGIHAISTEIDAKDLPPPLVTQGKKNHRIKNIFSSTEDEADRRCRSLQF